MSEHKKKIVNQAVEKATSSKCFTEEGILCLSITAEYLYDRGFSFDAIVKYLSLTEEVNQYISEDEALVKMREISRKYSNSKSRKAIEALLELEEQTIQHRNNLESQARELRIRTKEIDISIVNISNAVNKAKKDIEDEKEF